MLLFDNADQGSKGWKEQKMKGEKDEIKLGRNECFGIIKLHKQQGPLQRI